MHFRTFFLTTTALALVNASPAMMRRYVNETTTEMPTFTNADSIDTETMPTTMPSNSTIESGYSITLTEVEQLTTSVESITLIYTVGPVGSSSVVTTVVESTTTVTMHSTTYVTITITDDENPVSFGPTPTVASNGSPVEPKVTNVGYIIPSTPEPPSNAPGDSSGPPDVTGAGADGGHGRTTNPNKDGSGGGKSKVTDGEFFPAPESTVTITNYLTTTLYITLEPVETGSSAGAVPHDGANVSPTTSGGQNSVCGVTTITATIVEQSTVTVTPTETSTDDLPILATITPNFGYGNGTEQTSHATTSSGFATMLKRGRPH